MNVGYCLETGWKYLYDYERQISFLIYAACSYLPELLYVYDNPHQLERLPVQVYQAQEKGI